VIYTWSNFVQNVVRIKIGTTDILTRSLNRRTTSIMLTKFTYSQTFWTAHPNVVQRSWLVVHPYTRLGFQLVLRYNFSCWSIWYWCILDQQSLLYHISYSCNTGRHTAFAWSPLQRCGIPLIRFHLLKLHRALSSRDYTFCSCCRCWCYQWLLVQLK